MTSMVENATLNIERAEEIKLLANDAFKAIPALSMILPYDLFHLFVHSANKFSQAIELYSQAIELNGHNAVYWANRAFAHTKLEEYGSAIQDATKAVELDPKYSKVKKISPNDPDAAKKLKECEKAVQKLRFEEAIAVQESERCFVADSIDFHCIDVEPQYTGARIEGEVVTLDFVKKMMEDFRNQKCLHKRYAYQIVLQAREMLRALPPLVDIAVPNGHHFTVCGDVHGQVDFVEGIAAKAFRCGFRNGYIDPISLDTPFSSMIWYAYIATERFGILVWYRYAMYLSRGNHETKSMNKIYGFEGEIFVVHGGLFSLDGVTLSDIRALDRFCEPPEEGLMCELLWSDPQPQLGRGPSKRGVGLSFGPDVTKKFLEENNLDLVVRSHEVKDEGYEIEHDGKLITVFSAPNYCDQMGNKGAFIRFAAEELKPDIVSFSAVPHPDVKPMAYANNFLRLFS
ncbi:Serine/threonine-protein phosphatase 5 [Cocos nucifera]|uniref:protein-serine/threonine phosphatase n=1 Tax=Cocos nucifera TaxID=13894 RepID=A0A8K0MZ90_COCNU|nr:Serine/threonine-protein phosphatase 5 [Cocos nucifera]